jgi:hypothetical protein
MAASLSAAKFAVITTDVAANVNNFSLVRGLGPPDAHSPFSCA